MAPKTPNQLADHFFRHHHAKMVAILVRYFGLEAVVIAEDIVQDTLVAAMEQWSAKGIPHNPEGWLMAVAKNRTISYLKRQQHFKTKVQPAIALSSLFETTGIHHQDSTLRMLFCCCHPQLPLASQMALALKNLCGLSVSEIAHALKTTTANINKRLFRSKQLFRQGTIVFEIPENAQLHQRTASVLFLLYLLFNEGYYASQQDHPIRMELCLEAVRLMRDFQNKYPNHLEANALLALMLLHVSRFNARLDNQGALVILADQDRTLWDQDLIAEGMHFLGAAMGPENPGPYHWLAGIAAEHCLAKDWASTPWQSIYQQYSLLEQRWPNVFVSFNKAVAKYFGIDRLGGLADLLALQQAPQLQKNVHFYCALGVCHAKLGQYKTAIPYYQKALKLSQSKAEKTLIQQKIEACY
ncbi:MAG: sigma-70 family RNA polymerase sigma factor [Bacteroidota bacterium]